MNDLQIIFNKIKSKYPDINLIYDEQKNLLRYTNNNCTLDITKKYNGFNARFWHKGMRYDVMLKDKAEVCRVLILIKNGKIRVIEDPKRPNHAKITNIYECRYNKKSVVRYILPTLIGLGIIIFSVLMISQGLESIESHHGVWEITDMGLIAFFLGGVYAGVILICYAFGRRINPAPYFFGVLVAAFGLCELFFVADDTMKNESTVGQTIGTSIVFLMIILAGVMLIWLGHEKKSKMDLVVKRTANLPSPKKRRQIFNSLGNAESVPAYVITLKDGNAEYTGSRAGGEPYCDGSTIGPDIYIQEGEEFTFLFQINLRDIQGHTELPEGGILQFFLLKALNNKDSEIRTVYYPYVNEMIMGSAGDSVPLQLTLEKLQGMASPSVYDMKKVRDAANRLGIALDPDLDWFELFGDMVESGPHECYLMGPAKLPIPPTEAYLPEERYVNRPLLMLDSEEEYVYETLLSGGDEFEFMNVQVFSSLQKLRTPDAEYPEDVVTVRAFDVDPEYGKWDFK